MPKVLVLSPSSSFCPTSVFTRPSGDPAVPSLACHESWPDATSVARLPNLNISIWHGRCIYTGFGAVLTAELAGCGLHALSGAGGQANESKTRHCLDRNGMGTAGQDQFAGTVKMGKIPRVRFSTTPTGTEEGQGDRAGPIQGGLLRWARFLGFVLSGMACREPAAGRQHRPEQKKAKAGAPSKAKVLAESSRQGQYVAKIEATAGIGTERTGA